MVVCQRDTPDTARSQASPTCRSRWGSLDQNLFQPQRFREGLLSIHNPLDGLLFLSATPRGLILVFLPLCSLQLQIANVLPKSDRTAQAMVVSVLPR